MLTRYLTGTSDKCVLDGALIYGSFQNMKGNVEFFRQCGGKLYDKAIGYNYALILKEHEANLRKYMSPEAGDTFFKNLHENKLKGQMNMSENVMAPFFGFQHLDDYYDNIQATGHLHKIRVPTFFLNAIDDPIIDPKTYPFKEMESNEYVVMATTLRGGHCTHFTGKLRPQQWFPKPFLQFLDFLSR